MIKRLTAMVYFLDADHATRKRMSVFEKRAFFISRLTCRQPRHVAIGDGQVVLDAIPGGNRFYPASVMPRCRCLTATVEVPILQPMNLRQFEGQGTGRSILKSLKRRLFGGNLYDDCLGVTIRALQSGGVLTIDSHIDLIRTPAGLLALLKLLPGAISHERISECRHHSKRYAILSQMGDQSD